MRDTLRGWVAVVATAVLATTAVTMWGPTQAHAASPETCSRPDFGTSTPPSHGQSAALRPVVFVHGWTGKPMTQTASDIQKTLHGQISTYTFDYTNWASYWASNDHIAPCLADYLRQVSDAYRAVGGDGRLIYVAHSMGGLAIRYAMDPTKVAHPATAAQVPWLITLDTPSLGSPMGDLGIAQGKEVLSNILGSKPNPFGNDGGRCLKLHTSGQDLPASCDGLPPWLPGGTTLDQIGGAITVQRYMFGIHLYDVPLDSDGIVDYASSTGYLKSGPGGTAPVVSSPTNGTTVHSHQITCDVSSGQIHASLEALQGTLGSVAVPFQEITDWATLTDLSKGYHTPFTDLIELAATEPGACSHVNITKNHDAEAQLVTDIRGYLASAAPLRPVKTVEVTTHRITGADGTYPMRLWAQDNPTDCSAHSHGQVVAYFRQHPCRGLSRYLWTMPYHGRTLAVAVETIEAESGPFDPTSTVHLEYEWANKLVNLETADGTGGINDLVMEGHRVPGFTGTVIPAQEAFDVENEDNGVVVFDAWYVNGPTTSQDPDLVELEQGLFLTPASFLTNVHPN